MVRPREERDNDGLLEGRQGYCFHFSQPLFVLEGSESSFLVANEECLQELRVGLARGGGRGTTMGHAPP